MDFTRLATEIATEIRLLRAACPELTTHAVQRETCYRSRRPCPPSGRCPG